MNSEITLDALIGMTGFVGRQLKRQHDFPAQFNRGNIAQSSGPNYGIVVCAAAPGSMLEANKFPEQDEARIDALIQSLSEVSAERFVLISTIAVLSEFDAGSNEYTTDFQQEIAYGRNRRRLEEFINERFDNSLIVRLPALFGAGLKKNFLFDLLNPCPSMLSKELHETVLDRMSARTQETVVGLYSWSSSLNMFQLDREAFSKLDNRTVIEAELSNHGVSSLNFHHRDSTFQFYGLDQLWADIRKGLNADIDVLHLSPEPLKVGHIFEALTGKPMSITSAKLHQEDMRTCYAHLWGESGHYMAPKDDVIKRIKCFFSKEKMTS